MKINRIVLYTLLGMAASESFLGFLHHAADEAQTMLRNDGPLMQGINGGLKVLRGHDDQKIWQVELRRVLVGALRQARGKNRTIFLKALASFNKLQKRNASREECVAAISLILGDLWETNVAKHWLGGEDYPLARIFNHALDIVHHRHRENTVSFTESDVSVMDYTARN